MCKVFLGISLEEDGHVEDGHIGKLDIDFPVLPWWSLDLSDG
jgi:hypothetical protein